MILSLIVVLLLPSGLLMEEEACNKVFHLNLWGRGDWYAQYAYCRYVGMQLVRIARDDVLKISTEIKRHGAQKDEPFYVYGNSIVDPFSVGGPGCAVLENGQIKLKPCSTRAYAICQFVS